VVRNGSTALGAPSGAAGAGSGNGRLGGRERGRDRHRERGLRLPGTAPAAPRAGGDPDGSESVRRERPGNRERAAHRCQRPAGATRWVRRAPHADSPAGGNPDGRVN
jgi:hypothetical protein